jgi:hypothetical protein
MMVTDLRARGGIVFTSQEASNRGITHLPAVVQPPRSQNDSSREAFFNARVLDDQGAHIRDRDRDSDDTGRPVFELPERIQANNAIGPPKTLRVGNFSFGIKRIKKDRQKQNDKKGLPSIPHWPPISRRTINISSPVSADVKQ